MHCQVLAHHLPLAVPAATTIALSAIGVLNPHQASSATTADEERIEHVMLHEKILSSLVTVAADSEESKIYEDMFAAKNSIQIISFSLVYSSKFSVRSLLLPSSLHEGSLAGSPAAECQCQGLCVCLCKSDAFPTSLCRLPPNFIHALKICGGTF